MKKSIRVQIIMFLLVSFVVLFIRLDSKKLELNEDEIEFLNNHKEIYLAPDPNFAPIEFFDEKGNFSGINSDYINWINQNTDLKIVIKKYENWDQIIEDIKNKKIDMLSGVVRSKKREEFLKFTDTYIEMPNVIITRDSFENFSMDNIENMSIAVVESYFSEDLLEEKYPNKNLIKVDRVIDGIKLVSFGQVDSYVGSLGAISYYLEEVGISNIKIVGEFEESFAFNFAVRDDYPELKSILDKIIDIMPEKEKKYILRKWISLYPKTPITEETFFTNIIIIIVVLLAIVVLSFIWNYILKKEVDKKTQIIKKLNRSEKDKLELLVYEKTKELEKANKELVESEKIALIGRLVAGVAHEVNTPLGVSLTATTHIINKNKKYKKKLDDGSLTKNDLLEYMKSIEESTEILNINLDKAADLIKNFKKVAVNQSINEKIDFNVYEYIDSIILSLGYKFKKNNYVIDIDCPKNINIYNHPGFFSQILTNFIMNSINHGFIGNEGSIKIKVREIGDKLEIQYLDDGVGIDKKHIDNIFEPFFTTSRDKGGSGLGLNIVYNIVNTKLNGSIEVESEKGKGVKFKIVIPINNVN